MMTRKTGRGAKWVLDNPEMPICKSKKKVCTYVKKELLSQGNSFVCVFLFDLYILDKNLYNILTEIRDLCESMPDRRLKHSQIAALSQRQRSCRVPAVMHPATNTKRALNNVLSYFQKKLDDMDVENTRLRMRLASSSEDMSEEMSEESDVPVGAEEADAQKDVDQHDVPVGAENADAQKDVDKQNLIPIGICAQVDAMIDQLNDAYRAIPDKPHRTRAHVNRAYHQILRQSSMWTTKSAGTHFPPSRFIAYVDLGPVFPTGHQRSS